MNVVLFCHSIASDWNHGNAHFLRGIARELVAREHRVRIYEPESGWSRQNLVAEHGPGPLEEFRRVFPELTSTLYDLETLDVDAAVDHADLVLVHEWNDPRVVRRVGLARARAHISAPLPRHPPPLGHEAARDGPLRPAPLRRRPRVWRGAAPDVR
jgi:spore maturation protein CgeB